MTNHELYELKRKNFIQSTKLTFDLLLKSMGFSDAEYIYKQENGTVTRDEICYKHKEKNLKIEFSNSYHPVDYGMEINVQMDSKSEMIYYKLKEEQDIEQTYIVESKNIVEQYLK